MKEKFQPGLRLKEVRLAKAQTTAEFAKSIGITHSSMRHAESGRKMSVRLMFEVCAVHMVNPDWLIDGTGEMDLPPLVPGHTLTRRQVMVHRRRDALLEQAPKDTGLAKIDRHTGKILRQEPAQQAGNILPTATMAQLMQGIADQLAIPVERVREAVMGLLKSEGDKPKKKG